MNLKNISLTFLVTILCVGLTATTVNAKKSKKLKVGQMAPDFELPDSKQDPKRKTRKLSEFLGKNVVLCFIPYANNTFSPHCTKQACTFNKHLRNFTLHDTEIIFISYDDVKTLAKFENQNYLGITLLSDSDKKVAKLYGAYSWWWPLPERRTIIIDKTGKVKMIMKNVDYENNVLDVAKALDIKLEEK